MAEEKKDSKSKVIIVLLIIVIVLLLAGVCIGAIFILGGEKPANDDVQTEITSATTIGETENEKKDPLILDYDSSAIALDEESLQKAIDRLQEKVADGYVNLTFRNVAESDDGINFICHLGNDTANKYDMFFNIYKDITLEEQIYLSGLIAPGTAIDSFVSEIKLDPGEYSAIVFFTSVEDDHATMHSQVAVELELVVH